MSSLVNFLKVMTLILRDMHHIYEGHEKTFLMVSKEIKQFISMYLQSMNPH